MYQRWLQLYSIVTDDESSIGRSLNIIAHLLLRVENSEKGDHVGLGYPTDRPFSASHMGVARTYRKTMIPVDVGAIATMMV